MNNEKIENQEINNEIVEIKEKPYYFRKLKASDISTMTKLIKKNGISKIKNCFQSNDIKKLIVDLQEKEQDTQEKEQNNNLALTVGISLVTELVQIIIESYDDCEQELFKLLSDTSNLTLEQVKDLEFDVFFEMLFDFFKKEELLGFLKPVLKSLGMAD